MATDVNAPSESTGTYVYGVIPTPKSEEAGAFGVAIDASKSVRTIREDGLTAIVSDALQQPYDASRANLGAHERIVRAAYERGDILPMRFGSVAQNDEAVQRFLHDKHDELAKSLDALHGRTEVSLKVTWDPDAILREVVAEDSAIGAMSKAIVGQPEDQTYDQRIHLGRKVSEAVERRRAAAADAILERLRAKAIDVDIHRLASDEMVLNAAFLIDRGALQELDEAVSAVAAEYGDWLTLKYLGPLPPYSFVKVVVSKEDAPGRSLESLRRD